MDKEKAYKTIAKHIYIVTNMDTREKILILADNYKEVVAKVNKWQILYDITNLEKQKMFRFTKFRRLHNGY